MAPETNHSVLLIRNGDPTFDALANVLKRDGYRVDVTGRGTEAPRLLRSGYRAVVADLSLDDVDADALLQTAHAGSPAARVVFIAPPQQEARARRLVEAGAESYFVSPFDCESVEKAVADAVSPARPSHTPGADSGAAANCTFCGIVGKSPSIRTMQELIRKVADTTSTVLISGESGSGKELVAKAVHALSRRADDPFVVVHCGAIPETLLESELFGHERGAFTGAYTSKPGLFKSADGGAVFLDEIGEITPATQVKLLRVLESGVVRPVGSIKDAEVKVRVIAATNRNLQELVRQGAFREDLFYRLNVFPIHVPPLRERRGDIPLLIGHFLRRISTDRGVPAIRVSADAMELLQRYSWPGNIRELENLIERAAILCGSEEICTEHLPPEIRTCDDEPRAATDVFDLPFKAARNAFERDYVERILDRCNGNVALAARTAGVSRAYFYEIIKKYAVR